jgi:uncharacterized damage-inducible protein DinB
MAISKDALLSHLGYSGWADQRVLAACAVLTPEELRQDLKVSHTSVWQTLFHLCDGERFWLDCLHRDRIPALADFGQTPPAPFLNLQQMQQAWQAHSDGLLDYYRALPEVELYGSLRGSDSAMARWEVAMHVVNHATLHRGQVITMLRQLGKQPPANIDIFTYYVFRDRGEL